MKKMNKAIALVLAGAMTASTLAGCGGSGTSSSDSTSSDNTSTADQAGDDSTDVSADGSEDSTGSDESNLDVAAYEATSTEIYDEALGDFYDAYTTAKEAGTVSERFALMAVAEAKLMEAAVTVPTTTRGGIYQVSRVAPRSSSTVLWGNDNERYHQKVVIDGSNGEMITNEQYETMISKWNELRGTGKYESWVKEYLQSEGYTLKDTFEMPYTAEVTTWDVLASSQEVDSMAIVNTYDGLLEYDCENELQPALAESYEVSEDGLTYTFKIREGVEWVDSQGRKVADVTADDFVAGMQHMMDAQGGLEYLVQGIIENASEYIDGSVTDFAEVGVKAVDEYTLEYTLTEPCSYFLTMLGYGVFAPMSRTYYESQGGKFGSEFDASASDYTYGKDSNSIAYCGPYLVTNATAENTIVYEANDSYWNKDNINIKKITWLWNDGTDATKGYTDFKNLVLDYNNLNTSTIEIAKTDELFDDYAHVTDTESSSFSAFYNLNRTAFTNFNDSTIGVSSESEEEQARTNTAMNNVHFRRAVSFAFDRSAYNAQKVGEDLKTLSLRNSYVPGNFVSLEEDVIVDINGTATIYAAGTYYGQIMQDQIDADGVTIKVWDAENETGDGFDGWYNVENAVAELDTAIDELSAEGLTIDEENPIVLELPYPSTSETYANGANAFKKSVEEALGGKVTISLMDVTDTTNWQYCGYLTDYGYEANYDIYDLSGWGPDYGDPATYLDTFLPDYEGYMTKCLGIF